jgi:hypothetical protein
MANTSATGGALTPNLTPTVLDGDALDNFLQAWIVGLTGYASTLVRPRWQPEPPNLPAETVDWMAFGIMRRVMDPWLAEIHHGEANGYDETRRHRELHLLASFYGPNADTFAAIMADGMQIPQNTEILAANGINLIRNQETVRNPELVKEKWMNRVDLEFSLKQQIVRNYPIMNILTAETDINNEHFTEIVLTHQ